MYCVNCGKQLDNGNKFCAYCGTKVKENNETQNNNVNNNTSFFVEKKNAEDNNIMISQGKNEINDETDNLLFPKEEPLKNDIEDMFFSKGEPSNTEVDDIPFSKEAPIKNDVEDLFFPKEESTKNETDDLLFPKEESSNSKVDDILFSKEDPIMKHIGSNVSMKEENTTDNSITNKQKNHSFEKKNNYLPIIIIGIAGVIALIVFGLIFLGIGKIIKTETENYSILEVNKMSIKYDKTWTLNTSKSSTDSKVIYKDHYVISLIYSKASSYISTYTFTQTMINENKKSGYSLDSDIEDLTINGIEWKSITYTNTTNKYQQLFYSTGYEMYSFIYATEKSSFDKGKEETKKIMNTLTIDNKETKKGEEEAKKTLVGEWDWRISGYFVITNNEAYLYKDSTKSMNNVMIGTYTADNKIPTNAKGYVEGIHMIFTINKVYMDGTNQKANTFSREYTFTKNTDGTYTIWNLSSDFSGVAKKVR